MIEFNQVIIDAANNSAYIKLKGIIHLFSSYEKFVELTKFPFSDIIIGLCYEPERGLFAVTTLDHSNPGGRDNEYIQWVDDNLDNIVGAAYEDGYGKLNAFSFEDLRNAKLIETDWMVIRHKEQLEMGWETSLNIDQYQSLLIYRQELRDITKKYTSLDDVVWPILDL